VALKKRRVIMDTLEIIRNNIFKLLKRKGVTDAEFADKLCISRPIINRWRYKTSISYVKYLNDIAEFFHVSVSDLIGDEPKTEMDSLIKSVKEREELQDLLMATKNASKEEVNTLIKIMEALKKDLISREGRIDHFGY
jgi:transcriptional regulator with XRE-family HTH domain